MYVFFIVDIYFWECVMHLFASRLYLLGTMLTGVPKLFFMNSWLGILQRFVHMPMQLASSKNLKRTRKSWEFNDESMILQIIVEW